jgi:hypothetical protein
MPFTVVPDDSDNVMWEGRTLRVGGIQVEEKGDPCALFLALLPFHLVVLAKRQPYRLP